LDLRPLYEWLVGAPWRVGAAVALVAVLVEVARTKIRKWIVARKLRLQSGRALAAEAWAARLLTRAGYRLLGAQVKATYELRLDGRPVPIELRADYVVERAGCRWVAEVKSGQLAPSLETAATRRQLLEYRMAFAVDGVLLVDGETGLVHEVVFPAKLQSPATKSRQALLAPY
jgi:hypothetical protein